MNRRQFLQSLLAIPFIAKIPAYPSTNEEEVEEIAAPQGDFASQEDDGEEAFLVFKVNGVKYVITLASFDASISHEVRPRLVMGNMDHQLFWSGDSMRVTLEGCPKKIECFTRGTDGEV